MYILTSYHGQYTIGDKHEVMGQALKINLTSPPKKGDTVLVNIKYSTSNESMALGWLAKEYVWTFYIGRTTWNEHAPT
jgi:hypothetical protein